MKTTSLVLLASALALPALAQPAGPGYALSFDGGGASVSIQTTGSLTGTFTVELWANPNDPTRACGLGTRLLTNWIQEPIPTGLTTNGSVNEPANHPDTFHGESFSILPAHENGASAGWGCKSTQTKRQPNL